MLDYSADDTRSEGVVHATGELTIEHAADFRDMLVRALEENDNVTLDLSGVSETDVTIIQLILSASRTAENNNKKLCVDGLSKAVEEAVEAGGFARSSGLGG